MIVIVNYGLGNLRSVQKSLQRFHDDVEISNDPEAISSAEALVLPGVGAFADAMTELHRHDLVPLLKEKINEVPTLGICLGMQLLFESSEEDPGVKGLGVIKGHVLKLKPPRHEVSIPHTGWNRLIPLKEPYFTGHAYFNHSYHCVPKDHEAIVAWTLHGMAITAIIQKGQILGTQFHPEKSKHAGDKVFQHFLNMIKSPITT